MERNKQELDYDGASSNNSDKHTEENAFLLSEEEEEDNNDTPKDESTELNQLNNNNAVEPRIDHLDQLTEAISKINRIPNEVLSLHQKNVIIANLVRPSFSMKTRESTPFTIRSFSEHEKLCSSKDWSHWTCMVSLDLTDFNL